MRLLVAVPYAHWHACVYFSCDWALQQSAQAPKQLHCTSGWLWRLSPRPYITPWRRQRALAGAASTSSQQSSRQPARRGEQSALPCPVLLCPALSLSSCRLCCCVVLLSLVCTKQGTSIVGECMCGKLALEPPPLLLLGGALGDTRYRAWPQWVLMRYDKQLLVSGAHTLLQSRRRTCPYRPCPLPA